MIHANNCDQSLVKRVMTYKIEDLDAGADIKDIPIFRCPSALKILEVGIIPQGDDAGVNATNSCKVDIEVGSTAIASKSYTTAYPDAGVYDSLGAISNGERAEGDVLTVSVTNGATANPPAMMLQVEYAVLDKAMFDTAHVI